ncbi:MAG: RNA polymerase sigma factor SigM [Sciscionella sp.]
MSSAQPADTELIALHNDGDPRAFGELIGRHRDRMWAVALRTMRNPEDAADVVQEASISAFRAASHFRAESAVSTWLHRIVVNACLDRIRRQKVRATVPLPAQDAQPSTVRDAMAERETTLEVTAALGALPAEQRVPIVLVDIEGYSVGEAARLIGIAEGTVKSRCARGRVKLAQLLGHLRNLDANANVQGFAQAHDHGT